jgi:hypothetical protein
VQIIDNSNYWQNRPNLQNHYLDIIINLNLNPHQCYTCKESLILLDCLKPISMEIFEDNFLLCGFAPGFVNTKNNPNPPRHNNKLEFKPTPMLYMYFLSPTNSCFDYIFFLSKKLLIIWSKNLFLGGG